METVINNKNHISTSKLYLSLDLYSHLQSSDDTSALTELTISPNGSVEASIAAMNDREQLTAWSRGAILSTSLGKTEQCLQVL